MSTNMAGFVRPTSVSYYTEISSEDEYSPLSSPLGFDHNERQSLLPKPKRWRSPRRTFSEHRTFLSIVSDDLSDIPSSPSNSTAAALMVCRKKVIEPSEFFLKLVGWVPVCTTPDAWYQWVNVVYPVVVVLVILLGYVIQWAGCFCRFVADTGWSVTLVPMNNASFDSNGTMASSAPYVLHHIYSCKEFIISRYVIINILHSIGYAYSFYSLRIAEPEQQVALMERVFLFTTSVEHGIKEEVKLISNLRRMLFAAVIWMLLSVICDVMHVMSQYEHLYFSWLEIPGAKGSVILVAIMLASFSFLDVVYVAVVMNYAVQCRLLIFFIDGLIRRLNENTIRLFDAMEKCGEICVQMRLLNRNSSVAVSVVLINFVSVVILGEYSILKPASSGLSVMMYVSTSLSVLLWLGLITVPVVMAAMLTSRCSHLKKMGLVVRLRSSLELEGPQLSAGPSSSFPGASRPTPVPRSPLEDRQMPMHIDSFLNFMTALTMSAKLFMLPVRSGYILAVVLTASLTVLVLFQLGVVHVWLR